MSNSVLARMAVMISANTADFNKQLAGTRNDLKNFTGQITKIAGTLGVAFGVQQVASFAVEVSKLAGEAQGVRAAFERLPNSIELMSELKQSTGGTVSELELMKRAVQANNFDIELAALPKLLQFATLRAQQTGQSVDYLVDSIVTGIGRKSKLILDNLGISAVALGDKLKGVSTDAATVGDVARAVGEIAEESLSKMAGFSENASTKIQRLSASWENLKVAIGNAANSSGLFGTTLNVATNTINVLSGDELTRGLNQLKSSMASNAEILERFAAAGGKIDLSWQQLMEQGFFRSEAAAKKYEKVLADIAKKQNDLKLAQGEVDPITGMRIGQRLTPFNSAKVIETLEKLKEKQKELNKQFELTDINDEKKLVNIANEIIALQKLIDKYEALRKAKKEGKLVNPATDTATLSDRGLFTGNTTPNNPMRLSPFSNKFFDPEIKTSDWTAESNAALQAYQEELYKTADVAQEVGTSIGNAFATAAEGQNGFVRALAGITKDIVSMYLKQSIAAMIAASLKDPTTPLPFAKIAVAAAGIALINGLFSKIGSSGSSSSSSSGQINSSSRNSRGSYTQRSERVEVVISGKLEGQGDKIISDINKWQQKRGVNRG
jgi:hypothetical protein